MQAQELVAKLRAETGELFNEDFFNYCFKQSIKHCISGCREPAKLMDLVYHGVDKKLEFTNILHAEEGTSPEVIQRKIEAMLMMLSTAVHIAIAVEKQLMEQIEAEAEVVEISEEFSTEGVEAE